FFFQAEDGIRDRNVTGVQTCALPILPRKVGIPLSAEAPAPVITKTRISKMRVVAALVSSAEPVARRLTQTPLQNRQIRLEKDGFAICVVLSIAHYETTTLRSERPCVLYVVPRFSVSTPRRHNAMKRNVTSKPIHPRRC